MDRIIDDALLISNECKYTILDMLETINSKNMEEIKRNENLLPACQRIADSKKYHRLFMDAAISNRIISRIVKHEKIKVIPCLKEKCNLNEEDAEILFKFILYGSFAVNRSLNWEKNNRWYYVQNLLANFINKGIE